VQQQQLSTEACQADEAQPAACHFLQQHLQTPATMLAGKQLLSRHYYSSMFRAHRRVLFAA
jgi:hypothetical protein